MNHIKRYACLAGVAIGCVGFGVAGLVALVSLNVKAACFLKYDELNQNDVGEQ